MRRFEPPLRPNSIKRRIATEREGLFFCSLAHFNSQSGTERWPSCDRRYDVPVSKISADEQQRFARSLGECVGKAIAENQPCRVSAAFAEITISAPRPGSISEHTGRGSGPEPGADKTARKPSNPTPLRPGSLTKGLDVIRDVLARGGLRLR